MFEQWLAILIIANMSVMLIELIPTWAGSTTGATLNVNVAKSLKASQNVYYTVTQRYAEQGFTLNGTPTNTALLALMSLVPQFKKAHNLQVVNTVILTDGDAGDGAGRHGDARVGLD